ncbi:MAG: AAA family ATPase [Spirulina sp.]
MKRKQYRFYGDRHPENSHPDAPKTPEPYIASEELIKAVNLAIYLRRPLLLEGEAGCGKTRLARAVAYELGLPFYRWDIRSTTKAEEGLYKYDAILRLHDVQIAERMDIKSDRDPQNPQDYRKFGALGKAFQIEERPAVVLIDEIDKAELDFPNDLLAVLDDPWEFDIPETGEPIKARQEPIVIITSNKEKGNLPAPFLRRCLYYFVRFPSQADLQRIVTVHYQTREEEKQEIPPSALIEQAIALFQSIREKGLFKKPGTSEFLDWLAALAGFRDRPFPSEQLTLDNIPYPELLVKMRSDWEKLAGDGAI